MGCANSKPKGCQHCHCDAPYYSSVPRSFSVHVHHPPQTKGDSYHVVALTSTTLGSLDQVPHINHGNGLRLPSGKVIDSDSFRPQDEDDDDDDEEEEEKGKGQREEKTWSEMIEQMLPKAIMKTPISTPPCEPETINTWELMEGLEDTSPFRSPKHLKSFSFDVNLKGHVHVHDPPKPCGFVENGNDSAKSIGHQKREEEEEEGSNGCSGVNPAASDFDDNQVVVVYSSDESLLQGNMTRKGFSFSTEEEKKMSNDDDDLKGTPFRKEKVVLYFTSLRGVRKTYEDSCHVRLILKGLGVRVDERDVSMHSGFKEELKELLGHGYGKGGLGLPRVFIGRNYIGGAEDIQQLHEDGKLEKLLDCCEKIKDNVDDEGVCEACGDVRFVPCETCYGSCKIYYEGYGEEEQEEEQEDDDGEVGDYGFHRCPDCNENGLIRCPICCY